jgi:hypothetical protein
MAAPVLIKPDNRAVTLVRSTNPRGSTPDGNYYIDLANDLLQIITLEENATVDLGSGAEANPLANTTKIQLLALYFELLEVATTDAAVQNYLGQIDAVGNRMGTLVGAMAFVNGVKLDSTNSSLTDERQKIADSGFTEFAALGLGNVVIDRVYHGAKAQNVDAGTQCYYQLSASLSEADRQAAQPVDFSKLGAVNEVIQTFGTTANGDAAAGDFDSRTGAVLILNARQFGFTTSEVNSSTAGTNELGAYSQVYSLSQGAVNELSGLSIADVFGGAAITPYTGITFNRLAVPQTESGFNESDGNFTDVVSNTAAASLLQIRAKLDAWALQDTNINDSTATTGDFLPRRAEPLYSVNAQGKIVTRRGLLVEGIAGIDQQGIIFTDDAGGEKTNPAPDAGIDIKISAAWFDDVAGGQWFRLMYEDGAAAADFETANAVTVNDSNSTPVAGDKDDARILASGDDYILRLSYAHGANTQAGLNAGEDKPVVFQIGSTATKRRTVRFTVTSAIAQAYDAVTESETNA